MAAPRRTEIRTAAVARPSPPRRRRRPARCRCAASARLFGPYRWPLAVVTAIIVASSRGRAGLAVPAPRGHRHRAAGPERAAAGLAGRSAWSPWPPSPRRSASSRPGSRTKVGQHVMHGLRTDVFAHLQRQSIAFFTRTRTGEVQSRITNDIGGMQSVVTSTATSIASNLTTAVAHRRGDGRAVLAAVADLAGRHAAGHLPDPQGRPDAPGDHRRSSSASWPTSTSPSRRACRSAACS